MIASLKQQILSNPLLVREMRRFPNLTIRSSLLRSCAASLVFGYFIGVWLNPYSQFINSIIIILGMAVLAIPPFVAYVAASLTVDDLRGKNFDLLQMTGISDTSLVEGYIASAWYRCRLFFALGIAFTPLVLIRALVVAGNEAYFRCMVSAVLVGPCTMLPSPQMVLSYIVIYVVLVVTLMTIGLLAAALGVLFAGLFRSVMFSTVGAIITTIVLIVVLAGTAVGMTLPEQIIRGVISFLIVCGAYFVVIHTARSFMRVWR